MTFCSAYIGDIEILILVYILDTDYTVSGVIIDYLYRCLGIIPVLASQANYYQSHHLDVLYIKRETDI